MMEGFVGNLGHTSELEDAQRAFDQAHATHLRAIMTNVQSPSGVNAAAMSRARFARSDAFDELVRVRRGLRVVS